MQWKNEKMLINAYFRDQGHNFPPINSTSREIMFYKN
jgi:hypothetical protein